MIRVFVWLLNTAYLPLKLFRTRNKVFFVSRQHAKLSLEYKMIIEHVKVKDTQAKVVVYNRILKKDIPSVIAYFFGLFVQMYHIATSKVVVTDGYCIPISVLRHKKELVIIQLWHTIGVMKKFGIQSLPHKSKHDQKIAKYMKMHKNYSYAICSSTDMAEIYQKAFDMSVTQMKVLGTPTMDYLFKQEPQFIEDLRRQIIGNNKPIVVYLPTLRKHAFGGYASVIEGFDYNAYNLVIKLHPHDYNTINDGRVINTKGISAEDLIGIADYVITDYSGVVHATLLKKKRLLFYVPDIDSYKETQGLCVDIEDVFSKYCFHKTAPMMEMIRSGAYDSSHCDEFIKSYLNMYDGNAVSRIARFILDIM